MLNDTETKEYVLAEFIGGPMDGVGLPLRRPPIGVRNVIIPARLGDRAQWVQPTDDLQRAPMGEWIYAIDFGAEHDVVTVSRQSMVEAIDRNSFLHLAVRGNRPMILRW